jgi:hypothetical protein
VLAAVGDDGTVRMYDPFNKKLFHKIESAHNNSINVARFLNDNLLVRAPQAPAHTQTHSFEKGSLRPPN